MFLLVLRLCVVVSGFPRVCGDVSLASIYFAHERKLSPRMRGCFQAVLNKEIYAQAFPAYAGMFLASIKGVSPRLSFPRVCGDVSADIASPRGFGRLSPRMRGCFCSRF